MFPFSVIYAIWFLQPDEPVYSQPDDVTLAQFGLASIQAHECSSPSSPSSVKHQQHETQYHQQRESRSRGKFINLFLVVGTYSAWHLF